MRSGNYNCKFLLLLINIVLFSAGMRGQYNLKHTVYFENGQASISLEQLDSIKKLAKQSISTTNNRIVVHTYANDAFEGDSNYKLSGRRAYLVQQCLERAGINLGHMQIENKVRHIGSEEGCATCADILLTTDSNFVFQNVYHDQVAAFLMEGSNLNPETFWVRPFEDILVTTKEGLLVRIPKGTLATKDSGLVKLEVRYLKNKWDMLLHSLETRSLHQEFLELNRVVHLSVSQYGEPLLLQGNQNITVIVPSDVYHKNTRIYEQKKGKWSSQEEPDHLILGSFYGGETYYCNDSGGGLVLPSYLTPPVKPTYIPYDSVTAHQDKQLATIKVRMDYLEEQKVNEKGKKQELNPQQKRNEYLLKTKKDRLLIAKEKIKIQTREKNEEQEASYYKTLAIYNKKRSSMQQSYLKDLDRLGAAQKEKARRCQEHKESVALLQEEYGQQAYGQIAEVLRNQTTSDPLGYWLKTNQLGWLSIGQKAKRENNDAVPYRVTSDVSAYKITAFLIFDETQDVVVGETLDDTDIVFWEVPDGKSAKLLAVTQEGEFFLIAFHELITSGNPIKLEFKNKSLRDILGMKIK
jgi:hypothetical protein